MPKNFPLTPEMASTFAADVDLLYYTLVAISTVLTLMVALCVIVFAIKYRRRPGNEIPVEYQPWHGLEAGFIIAMTVIFLGFFLIGAQLFFRLQRPPDNALNVYATGKQWMWKFQHINGQWEINSLHVPVGRPIKLTMASEDVIHSFFVPAFRVKRDVLPSRYTEVWFEANRTGQFHLFCAEYCGSEHARMIGSVTVMEPTEYQAWLDNSGAAAGASPAAAGSPGEALFTQYGCVTCHQAESTGLGPSLIGVAGSPVTLRDGTTVVADDDYLRESILNPQAQVVEGYAPVMPSFAGQLSQSEVQSLIQHIRSMSAGEDADSSGGSAAGGGQLIETADPNSTQTPAGAANVAPGSANSGPAQPGIE